MTKKTSASTEMATTAYTNVNGGSNYDSLVKMTTGKSGMAEAAESDERRKFPRRRHGKEGNPVRPEMTSFVCSGTKSVQAESFGLGR